MNEINLISKYIFDLEMQAKNGDILSAFKLFKINEYGITKKENDGNFITLREKNSKDADFYLELCNRLYTNSDNGLDMGIYLSDLTLIDFRKFKSIKIKLDRKLTIFIGNNGSGKTSIIDAIVKTISWIGPNIIRKGGRGKLVTDYDVNNASKRYAEINSRFIFNGNVVYEAALRKNSKNSIDNINSTIEPLEDLGEIYRTLVSERNGSRGEDIALPIFLYYSADRNNIKINRTFDEGKLNVSLRRFEAYDRKTLDGAIDFSGFLEWLIVIDNLSGSSFKQKANEYEKLVSSLKVAGAEDEKSNLNKLYLENLNELNKLTEILKNNESYSKKIELVKSVIITAMPEINDIYVDKSQGRAEIMLKFEEEKINITQASQGQQILISLVSDIARKLITLNEKLENPLFSNGIIVIDEVELHFHPKWQQNIVGILVNCFPNIQFIITTHSPQVLSTVDKNNIRIFAKNEIGEYLSVPPKFQTKGVQSADIMAQIMGTDSIPDIQEARDVDQFSKLLSDGFVEEAMNLLDKLRIHFGSDHPIILNCKNSIKIYELKNKIMNK
ncbi:TPA: AAA family ATPase [Providencia rettgeri]|nr:AAA family ATPase [Providencia rettgeri]